MPQRWWKRDLVAASLIAAVAALSVAANTSLSAPPRFDGAGYAVLARSLAEGHGYRAIDHPDTPRHAHFPPGYPLALAGLWRLTGVSVPAAHLFAASCTVAAVLAAWRWFRQLYPARVALLLGLALAVNWTWGRTGGMIQSEPLYILLAQSAILLELRVQPAGRGTLRAIALGLVLGACILTRHVGVCLVGAVVCDVLGRRRVGLAMTVGVVALLVVSPWIAWLGAAGHDTQVALLAREGLGSVLSRQAVFYVRRIPDLWTGPFVEVGTVFRGSGWLASALTAWGVIVTGVLLAGWITALRTTRRRLAGLIGLLTLALLLAWPFTEAGRFLIPLLPCVLVGLVEGLGRGLAAFGRKRPRAWAAGIVLAASIPYAGYALATGRAEARRHTFDDFDAACAWLAAHPGPAGPVLTRHPGEVFWQVGRQALAPAGDSPDEVARLIRRYGVAYLLVDEDRYANAPANPLARYAVERPERVREVWARGSVTIMRVVPGPG